ncbi:MAG: hypothetical protein JST12_00655 [Armatimonadetes bacterium]|nr:hypothetical protein [Armatimonadota bacterium]
MKRVLALTVLMLAGTAVAQDSPSLWDRATSVSISIAKNLWTKLQEQGQPLAEKLLKAAPEYYKQSKVGLQDFVKRIDKLEIPKTFHEKQLLALELWKLRGAINVVALSNPQTVKLLLGFEPPTIAQMQKDLSRVELALKKANLPGI